MAAKPRPLNTLPGTVAPVGEGAGPTFSGPSLNAKGNRARLWLLRIGGTVLFVALLVWLDVRGDLPLGKVWDALRLANPWLLGLSIALYAPFLAVKAARWRLVCAGMRVPISWSDAWRIYGIGLAAGTFTPGQAGDALKAWYIQRKGYTLARGLASSVLDRLFDVAALAAVGLVGVVVYGGKFADQTPVLAGWVAICLVAVAFVAWNRTRSWAVQLVSKRLLKLDGRGAAQAEDWSLRPRTVLNAGLLTGASFALSIFRVWLLAAAVGVALGPLEVSGFVGLTTAAALVPVTVGGVGTRDVIAALAFTQLGLRPELGIATSLLILFLNLSQAIIGWAIWLRYRATGAVDEVTGEA